MADDRMKNDDLRRDMGGTREDQDYGKQTPGRNPQQDDQASGGQQGGQPGGQQGREPRDLEDDEFGGGSTGQGGGQNRGGQNG